MFAVAVHTGGGVFHTSLHGDTMNAFLVGCRNFLVAGRAGFRNPPVIHARAFVARGVNVVVAMAVVAVRRFFAPSRDGASVDALLIGFHRMCDGNLMAREETRIAMALGTGGGKPAVRHHGIRVGSGLYVVDVAMARPTFRGIGIAFFHALSVDAVRELFDLLRMALDALRRQELLGRGEFVDAAMTGRARGFAEECVGTGGERFGFFFVAGDALHPDDFCGVREVLYIGVAILATENGVGTGCKLGGVYINVFSLVGLHPCGAMAGQARFILLGWMRAVGVCGSASGSEHPRQREKHRA